MGSGEWGEGGGTPFSGFAVLQCCLLVCCSPLCKAEGQFSAMLGSAVHAACAAWDLWGGEGRPEES